jgi:hypothetical protein
MLMIVFYCFSSVDEQCLVALKTPHRKYIVWYCFKWVRSYLGETHGHYFNIADRKPP